MTYAHAPVLAQSRRCPRPTQPRTALAYIRRAERRLNLPPEERLPRQQGEKRIR